MPSSRIERSGGCCEACRLGLRRPGGTYPARRTTAARPSSAPPVRIRVPASDHAVARRAMGVCPAAAGRITAPRLASGPRSNVRAAPMETKMITTKPASRRVNARRRMSSRLMKRRPVGGPRAPGLPETLKVTDRRVCARRRASIHFKSCATLKERCHAFCKRLGLRSGILFPLCSKRTPIDRTHVRARIH